MWNDRTQLLIGEKGVAKLQHAHVLVAGLGGVGGAAAEMLVRAGIGELSIADGDHIHETNINRQLIATHSTVGKRKTEAWAARLLDINPNLKLHVHSIYLKDETLESLVGQKYSVIIDAIDTLSPKTYLIYTACSLGTPLVSSLGSGGRLDPTAIRISPFWEIENCRLARHLRKRLRRLNVNTPFPAVHSTEAALKQSVMLHEEENKKSRVGVISYIPNIFGAMAAGEAIRIILEEN